MTTGHAHILIVEPDPLRARLLVASLDRGGCRPRPQGGDGSRLRCGGRPDAECCRTVPGALHLGQDDLDDVDVVIIATQGDGRGLEALSIVRDLQPGLPVILVGPAGDAALAAESIRAGAMDFVVSDGTNPVRTLPLAIEKCLVHQRIKQENERLHRDLSLSLEELAFKNEQLEAVIRQLKAMARTDELTGLANRRWLNLTLEGSWAEASRHGLPLACLMIDLDGFKPLNDVCGHQRGDDLLRLVGRVIRANCRSVDCSARYGGDEFCILMPHTEPADAVLVARRLLEEFRLVAGRLSQDGPRLGMSIGLSHNRLSRPVNAEQLVTHADEALYGAKASGKDCIMAYGAEGVFDPTAPAALRDARLS